MRCLMFLFLVSGASIGIAQAESNAQSVVARFDADCDGVADARDACPKVPGSPSTTPSLHGCPQPSKVIVTGCHTPIVPMIHFARGARVVGDTNHRVIVEVAQALRENAELNIAVQGHTSSDEPNSKRLGEARARAVVAALVAAGIDPQRLTVESYGSERPLADNALRAGRERNRRVQFQRLDSKPGS